MEGPQLSLYDRKGLLDFPDQLEAAYQTLADQALLSEANTQTHLKAIFYRLPVNWPEGWVRRVIDIESKGLKTLCSLYRI